MILPGILYGTLQYKNQTAALTEVALKAGFRAFDSSTVYDEEQVGVGFSKYAIDRNKTWIQTKFSPAGKKYDMVFNTYISLYEQVFQSFDWSLQALHINYLDAYIVHSTVGHPELIDEDFEIWQALEAIHNSGQINYIGVSNVNLNQLKSYTSVVKVKPTIVQNNFRCNSVEDLELLQYCLENSIAYQGFSLPRLNAELLEHDKVSALAKEHNATNMQIMLQFFQAIGLTPLIGARTEQHIKDNIIGNIQLSSSEVQEIANLTSHPYLILSIYSKLQSGEFMKTQTVVDAIMHCPAEQLPDCMNKLAPHLAKIDPNSLAEIIAHKEQNIIGYLKQIGIALTSNGCTKIIKAKGVEFISLLQNELNIPADKLLMATLHLDDSQYFDTLFHEADLEKLTKHEISQIIKIKPSTIDNFVKANITVEKLLAAVSSLDETEYFDDLINKSDLGKLTSGDLITIINNKGLQIIARLGNKAADFSKLTYGECESLVASYGIEVIYILKEATNIPAHKLLFVALTLGDKELPDILIKQADLSQFTVARIAKVIECYPAALDSFIMSNVILNLLEAILSIKSVKYLDDFINKADLGKLNEVGSYDFFNYINDIITIGGHEVIKKLEASGVTFSKLSGYALKNIINGQGLEVIEKLKIVRADFSELVKYYLKDVLNHDPNAIYELIKVGIPVNQLLIVASDINNTKYFDDLVVKASLNDLNSYDFITIIKNKFESSSREYINIIPTKVGREIYYLSNAEQKREALDNVSNCIIDQPCFKKCLTYEAGSHLECAGVYNHSHEEL